MKTFTNVLLLAHFQVQRDEFNGRPIWVSRSWCRYFSSVSFFVNVHSTYTKLCQNDRSPWLRYLGFILPEPHRFLSHTCLSSTTKLLCNGKDSGAYLCGYAGFFLTRYMFLLCFNLTQLTFWSADQLLKFRSWGWNHSHGGRDTIFEQ